MIGLIIALVLFLIFLFTVFSWITSEGATGGWSPGMAHGGGGGAGGGSSGPSAAMSTAPIGSPGNARLAPADAANRPISSHGGGGGGGGRWGQMGGRSRSWAMGPYTDNNWMRPRGWIGGGYGGGYGAGYPIYVPPISPYQPYTPPIVYANPWSQMGRWSQWFNPWGARLPDCEDVDYIGPCYDGRA